MAASSERIWRFVFRAAGWGTRRLLRMELDDFMALGCGVVHAVQTTDPVLALTFDDGPSDHSTATILDILAAHQARATFFLIGENARRLPHLVRDIVARGHEVGCHSQHHRDFFRLFPWQIARELRESKRLLEDLSGQAIVSVRAPFLHFRWDVRPLAEHLGMKQLVGSGVVPAWDERSAPSIVTYVLARAQPGAIIALHDATSLEPGDPEGYSAAVVTALGDLLGNLRSRGYHWLSVSELIAHSSPTSPSSGPVSQREISGSGSVKR